MCRWHLSRGVVHWRVGQMDVQQSDETEHRQDVFHPSRDASTNQEVKISFHPARWHRRPVSTTVTCLGVLIDSEPTFAAHIKRLIGRCFYQLRQLRTVRRALSVDAARTFLRAFVISRVDYCNSIFGFTSAVHRPLQCVINAAARSIVKRRKFDKITDSLRDELHWLPVQNNHTYKICFLVYKFFAWIFPIVPRRAMHTD